jgi:2'-5' RNA ligase
VSKVHATVCQDRLASSPVAKVNGNGGNGHSSKLAPMDLERYRARVLDSYALVSYLPEPLSSFLDGLSKQLVPGCKPRSHITLLPPRHLSGPVEAAKESLETVIHQIEPFDLEITTIESFDITCVIYADIGYGRERLLDIHRRLNTETLYYREQFAYHPHVTLAINPHSTNVHELLGEAQRAWAAYPASRVFRVEELHFVHNVAPEVWEDVAIYPLDALASAERR